MNLVYKVFATPDLDLLVCPAPERPNDRSFYDINWRILKEHSEILDEKGFQWFFTPDLCSYILSEYPWNDIDNNKWLTDLMAELTIMLSKKSFAIECESAHSIDPNIYPDHTSLSTEKSWLHTISWRCYQQDILSCIPTMKESHQPIKEIKLLDKDDHIIDELQLIRERSEWDELHAQADPWFATDLPNQGDYKYEPPSYWQLGQDFPSDKVQKGYIDNRGRIWVWDTLHNDHWDVQYNPPRNDDYDRVTPDGRLLK